LIHINNESKTFWDDLKSLCIGHVPHAIESFRSQNARATEWATPRFMQLVAPSAVEALIQRANTFMMNVQSHSVPRSLDVGPLGSWNVHLTVFPSAADADFLRQCPNGSVEDYLTNCLKLFHSSCLTWSSVDYAHWMLLLNPTAHDASVHLYTQWSLVSFGQWVKQTNGRLGGPPFITPIDLLRENQADFIQRMMALDVDLGKP